MVVLECEETLSVGYTGSPEFIPLLFSSAPALCTAPREEVAFDVSTDGWVIDFVERYGTNIVRMKRDLPRYFFRFRAVALTRSFWYVYNPNLLSTCKSFHTSVKYKWIRL